MPLLLRSLHLPILSGSSNTTKPKSKPNSLSPLSSATDPPPLVLRFRTSHRQKLQYLSTLGIELRLPRAPPPPPEAVDRIVSTVEFLKSNGFSNSDFARLVSVCPSIFSTAVDADRTLDPVIALLADDLSAAPQQARLLILRCPELLVSDVDSRLRPTLRFLRGVGVKNLASPTNLNAHLLNTPVEKLTSKIEFFQGLGLSYDESARICSRCPAIFGYSVVNNLKPKVEYLVHDMGRPVDEVKKFPQFFGFSLEKKIMPRHLHLEERKVRIPLPRMLLWSDEKFYEKWK